MPNKEINTDNFELWSKKHFATQKHRLFKCYGYSPER